MFVKMARYHYWIKAPSELFANLPAALDLDHQKFVANVRGAKRGKSGGCAGLVTEHLRLLLTDEDLGIGSLEEVARFIAQGRVPPHARRALALGRMSGLDKRGVDVRGITTGHTLRRLVARTLAQQFAPQFGDATAPHQYALSVKAGIDAVMAQQRYVYCLTTMPGHHGTELPQRDRRKAPGKARSRRLGVRVQVLAACARERSRTPTRTRRTSGRP